MSQFTSRQRASMASSSNQRIYVVEGAGPIMLQGADRPTGLPPKRGGRVSFDLAEGVTIQAEDGAAPVAINVGTEDDPLWLVAPGANGDDVGIIPLVAAAAVKIVKKQTSPEAKEHRAEKREAREARRRAEVEAANAQPTLWQRIKALLTGARTATTPTKVGALTYIGDDDLGAILVDTDGRRQVV